MSLIKHKTQPTASRFRALSRLFLPNGLSRGARLGGRTGQFFLRFIGKDCFVTSGDMVACLRDAGLDIAETPSSRKDMAKIQAQFNAWAAETGLPLTHLSRICAMSIGENYDAETLRNRGGGEEE